MQSIVPADAEAADGIFGRRHVMRTERPLSALAARYHAVTTAKTARTAVVIAVRRVGSKKVMAER